MPTKTPLSAHKRFFALIVAVNAVFHERLERKFWLVLFCEAGSGEAKRSQPGGGKLERQRRKEFLCKLSLRLLR